MTHNHNSAYLHVVCGPMFSGKSTELLRLYNREIATGRIVQAFNYDGDKRYTEIGEICTHNELRIPSKPVSETKEIEDLLSVHTQTLIVDEVTFLDDRIITFAKILVQDGVKVILAGLDRDFRGEPFCFKDSKQHMGYLIALSDELSRLNSICNYDIGQGKICGMPATRTPRLIDGEPAPYSSPLIMIGGKENYAPRCHLHHIVPM